MHIFIREDYYNLGLRVCLYNLYGGYCRVSKLLVGGDIRRDELWIASGVVNEMFGFENISHRYFL